MQERTQLQNESEKQQTLQKIQKTNANISERREKVLAEIRERRKKNNRPEDDEWEDVDEHEREVFEGTGYFEVQDSEAHITAADQKLLNQMEGPGNAKDEGRTLADLIMQKLNDGDYVDGDKLDM